MMLKRIVTGQTLFKKENKAASIILDLPEGGSTLLFIIILIQKIILNFFKNDL